MTEKEKFNADMDELADAINEKAQTFGKKTVTEMTETVRNIPTGGGGTEVVPNPEGEVEGTLSSLGIDGAKYAIVPDANFYEGGEGKKNFATVYRLAEVDVSEATTPVEQLKAIWEQQDRELLGAILSAPNNQAIDQMGLLYTVDPDGNLCAVFNSVEESVTVKIFVHIEGLKDEKLNAVPYFYAEPYKIKKTIHLEYEYNQDTNNYDLSCSDDMGEVTIEEVCNLVAEYDSNKMELYFTAKRPSVLVNNEWRYGYEITTPAKLITSIDLIGNISYYIEEECKYILGENDEKLVRIFPAQFELQFSRNYQIYCNFEGFASNYQTGDMYGNNQNLIWQSNDNKYQVKLFSEMPGDYFWHNIDLNRITFEGAFCSDHDSEETSDGRYFDYYTFPYDGPGPLNRMTLRIQDYWDEVGEYGYASLAGITPWGDSVSDIDLAVFEWYDDEGGLRGPQHGYRCMISAPYREEPQYLDQVQFMDYLEDQIIKRVDIVPYLPLDVDYNQEFSGAILPKVTLVPTFDDTGNLVLTGTGTTVSYWYDDNNNNNKLLTGYNNTPLDYTLNPGSLNFYNDTWLEKHNFDLMDGVLKFKTENSIFFLDNTSGFNLASNLDPKASYYIFNNTSQDGDIPDYLFDCLDENPEGLLNLTICNISQIIPVTIDRYQLIGGNEQGQLIYKGITNNTQLILTMDYTNNGFPYIANAEFKEGGESGSMNYIEAEPEYLDVDYTNLPHHYNYTPEE